MWFVACALHFCGRTRWQVGSGGTSGTLCALFFVSLPSMVVHVPHMLGFKDRAAFACRVPRPRFGVAQWRECGSCLLRLSDAAKTRFVCVGCVRSGGGTDCDAVWCQNIAVECRITRRAQPNADGVCFWMSSRWFVLTRTSSAGGWQLVRCILFFLDGFAESWHAGCFCVSHANRRSNSGANVCKHALVSEHNGVCAPH